MSYRLNEAMDSLNAMWDEVVPTVAVVTAPEATSVAAPAGNCVESTACEVMAAYQNANKWLDSVKESIYTKMSCPFFSSFVHELAHTMPARFDKFGDILHTIDMEIPYPATAEIPHKPANLMESFQIIFAVLDAIKEKLNAFIKCTDDKYHGMACAAEVCLNDIEEEYPMLYRLRAKAQECGDDTVTFDKFVGQYVEHKGDLLESLNEDIGGVGYVVCGIVYNYPDSYYLSPEGADLIGNDMDGNDRFTEYKSDACIFDSKEDAENWIRDYAKYCGRPIDDCWVEPCDECDIGYNRWD